jgi:hypothetical protein
MVKLNSILIAGLISLGGGSVGDGDLLNFSDDVFAPSKIEKSGKSTSGSESSPESGKRKERKKSRSQKDGSNPKTSKPEERSEKSPFPENANAAMRDHSHKKGAPENKISDPKSTAPMGANLPRLKDLVEVFGLRLYSERIKNLKKRGIAIQDADMKSFLLRKADADVYSLAEAMHGWISKESSSFIFSGRESVKTFAKTYWDEMGRSYSQISLDLLDQETILATLSLNVYLPVKKIRDSESQKLLATRLVRPLAETTYRMMSGGITYLNASGMRNFIFMYLALMRPLVGNEGNIRHVVRFSRFVEDCLTDTNNAAHNRDLLNLLIDKRQWMEKLLIK